MATLEQLSTFITKAKTESVGAAKKSEGQKSEPDARKKLKKVKRLQRKVAKLTATAKMAEEKKKPKTERKSAAAE